MNKICFLGLVVLLGLFSSCDSSRNDDKVSESNNNVDELPNWFNLGTYVLGRNGESKSNVKVKIRKVMPRGGISMEFIGYNGDYTSEAIYGIKGGYTASLLVSEGSIYGDRLEVTDDVIYINSASLSGVPSMEGTGYARIEIQRYNQYGDIRFKISLPKVFDILGKEDKRSDYAKWLRVKQEYQSLIKNGVEQNVFTRIDR